MNEIFVLLLLEFFFKFVEKFGEGISFSNCIVYKNINCILLFMSLYYPNPVVNYQKDTKSY